MKTKNIYKLILLFGIISPLIINSSLIFNLYNMKSEPFFEEKANQNPNSSSSEWDEQISISVGTQPYSVFIGDANNDGFNDIVTANFYDDNISILLWNPNNNYWEEKLTKSTGIFPTSVSVGDANNDGYKDIVVGNQNTEAVSIFLWNSSIEDWNDELSYSAAGAWYVYIADANNDGWNDIVTANYVTDDISIILWNATTSYWNSQIRISVGSGWNGPIAVSVKDANNDGYNDITVANDRSQELLTILWNSTISYWDLPLKIYGGMDPYGVVVEDANNDGYNDIIAANRNGGYVPILFWNISLNDWTLHQLNTLPGSIFSMTVGDVNNDGYNDIVNAKITSLAENVASVHLWNVTSNYWDEEINLDVGNRPECVVIGDANNDGFNDIVTSNTDSNDVSILIYEPAYWFMENVNQFLTKDYFNFTFYLYNEDGFPIDFATFQMWWDGINVSNNINNLSSGYYSVSLEPKTVLPTEDPIKLNMTIEAIGYDDLYFEIYLAVNPFEAENYLNLDFINQTFSMEYFDLIFYIYDDFNQEIDFATIQAWWDGNDVSSAFQNLGNGMYSVFLEPIIVYYGDPPILLNISVAALGYEDLYLETYLAVDPDTVYGKGFSPSFTSPEVLLTLILLMSGSIAGLIGSIKLLSKMKRAHVK